jgi:hypothetical protein
MQINSFASCYILVVLEASSLQKKSTLVMEGANYCVVSEHFYQTTRRHISDVINHHFVNLRIHIV